MGLDFRRREREREEAKGWIEHVGGKQEACQQDEYVHVCMFGVCGTSCPFPGKVAFRRGCLLGRKGEV